MFRVQSLFEQNNSKQTKRMRKYKSAPIKDIDETDETDETGETEAGRMRQALPPPEIPPFYPQKCGDASEAGFVLRSAGTGATCFDDMPSDARTSGQASTNRPPFNPDGKLATWALNGVA